MVVVVVVFVVVVVVVVVVVIVVVVVLPAARALRPADTSLYIRTLSYGFFRISVSFLGFIWGFFRVNLGFCLWFF